MNLWVVLLVLYLQERSPMPALDLVDDLCLQAACAVRRVRWPAGAWMGLLLWLLLPLLLLAVLLHALHGHLWGLPSFVLNALLVLLVLGPHTEARMLPGEPAAGEAVAADHGAQLSLLLAHEMHESRLREQVLLIGRRHLRFRMSPLFWWVLLGPLGMLAVALLVMARRSDPEQPWVAELDRLLFWIEWLPGRCLMVSIALLGDFLACVDTLKTTWRTLEPSDVLLPALVEQSLHWPPLGDGDGPGSAPWQERIQGLQALFHRCRTFWVVVLAMLTLYTPLF